MALPILFMTAPLFINHQYSWKGITMFWYYRFWCINSFVNIILICKLVAKVWHKGIYPLWLNLLICTQHIKPLQFTYSTHIYYITEMRLVFNVGTSYLSVWITLWQNPHKKFSCILLSYWSIILHSHHILEHHPSELPHNGAFEGYHIYQSISKLSSL